ncbi:MAG: NYN domain-containing protein [Chloroflexi bacterium]|nr:NYN domain-containing protein [Chloroflexota bacterium]
MNRVAVFIDAQNVFRGALDCFVPEGKPDFLGQSDPLQIGELLASRDNPRQDSSAPRSLEQVRVYTGRPSSESRSYGAHMRQCAAWESTGVLVVHRPLKYSPDGPAQEKGIDVQLAIDFVQGAFDDTYDTGIIFSTDTDLRPALEFVATRYESKTVETAAWLPVEGGQGVGLRLQTPATWCHRLTRDDFVAVRDLRDYTSRTK